MSALPSAASSAQPLLQRLLDQLPDAAAVVLSRSDGVELGSALRDALIPSRVAAISSSMLALGQASLREMKLGRGDSVMIEGSDGKLLLIAVPHAERPAVLSIVARGDAVSGQLLWHGRQCVAVLAGNI